MRLEHYIKDIKQIVDGMWSSYEFLTIFAQATIFIGLMTLCWSLWVFMLLYSLNTLRT